MLCDVPGSEVTIKNEIFHARITVGNMFEIDWLHAVKGRSASISIPGVDGRSGILQGSADRFNKADFKQEEDNSESRRGSFMRMTRISTRVRKSTRSSTLRGTSVRRHSRGKKSAQPRNSIKIQKTNSGKSTDKTLSLGSRSDPNLSPVTRASNLRNSLTSRSVRKQSVSFIESPKTTQRKKMSRVASVRTSKLVRKHKESSQDDLLGSEDHVEFSPSGPAMSPTVQAVLAAAEKHKRKMLDHSRNEYSPAKRPDTLRNILSLFETEDNYREFKILERHPSLSPVFKGMSEGIGLYPAQFLEWKQFVNSLKYIDFSSVSRSDLVHLAAGIIPPQLDGDLHSSPGSNIGLWAIGKELTVIQTLLLATVVSPSSCRSVAELIFALTSQYLERGGMIIRHQDELSSDEDSDLDSEESENDLGDFIDTIAEEDEDEDEDAVLSTVGDIFQPEHNRNLSDIGIIRPSEGLILVFVLMCII